MPSTAATPCASAVYVDAAGFLDAAAIAALSKIELTQHWDAAEQLPRERGVGWVAYSAAGLHMGLDLVEAEPFTTATADGQPLYELGSVAEFFIQGPPAPQGEGAPSQPPGRYWEIHVSPNNKCTDIFVSDRDAFLAGTEPYAAALAHIANAQHTAARTPAGWSAQILVPWAAFGAATPPPPGTRYAFSMCRYNYPGRLEDPELSSTSPYTKLSYHRVEEFRHMVFEGPTKA